MNYYLKLMLNSYDKKYKTPKTKDTYLMIACLNKKNTLPENDSIYLITHILQSQLNDLSFNIVHKKNIFNETAMDIYLQSNFYNVKLYNLICMCLYHMTVNSMIMWDIEFIQKTIDEIRYELISISYN